MEAEPQQQEQEQEAVEQREVTPKPAIDLSSTANELESVAAPAPFVKPVEIDPRLQLKDIYLTPEIKLPEDTEVTKAKAFLKSKNLYTIIASRISQLISSRNSSSVSTGSAAALNEYVGLEDYLIPSKTLFKEVVVGEVLQQCKQVEVEGDLPDVMMLSRLWEWAGVSFGDSFVLFLALRQLMSDERLNSVRMWGKIHGTEKDYFVVEADTDAQPEEATPESSESTDENVVSTDETYAKPAKKVVPVVPTEVGGVNKYAYFVASSVNGPWTRLPHATPAFLVASRIIRCYLTGNLQKKIKSYPPFNGTEAHFLRAQIARISAATVVCPVNYYQIDDEDKSMKLNREYENVENERFLNPEQWVHHTNYILPQGRAGWVDTTVKREDEEEEPAEAEAETGPELLRTVGSDEDYGKLPAWRTTLCSKFLTAKYSPVMIQSTRWPGARSIVYNNQFTNIYVGDGVKGFEEGKPVYPLVPDMMKEYAGEEGDLNVLVEGVDPTVEEEHVNEEELQEKIEMAEEEE